jgi:hypothetical protein
VTRTSTKPASLNQPSTRSAGAAPATQPHSNVGSACSSGGSGAMLMTSDTASRPPGLRTRKASRNTCALSGTRLITQFEITTSAVLSAIGRCSSSPQAEFDVARIDASGVVARLFQHLVCHVDAGHAAGVADPQRREKTIKPGTAAEIDDDLARLHGGDRLRVAATEAQIGPPREPRLTPLRCNPSAAPYRVPQLPDRNRTTVTGRSSSPRLPLRCRRNAPVPFP